MKTFRVRTSLFAPVIAPLALCFGSLALHAQQGLRQTNLVSDLPGWAEHTDPNLVNPWGVSFSATSPFWVSNNGSNTSTLYNSTGTPLPLVVTVSGGPTGQVFTGGAFKSDLFVFATQSGTISGWRGALGTTAETLYTGESGSSYFGIAYAKLASGGRLYAANFGSGKVDVLDAMGAPILPGAFFDSTLPAGYSPFNIQNLGGAIYVAYALKGSDGDEVHAAGAGFVDKFDLDGNLLGRVGSNGTLNAPWGLAIAPSGFGSLGGALLVGNFGNGTIQAYDPTSDKFIGTLRNSFGGTLSIDGLWALTFGNGGSGGKADTLYFTAGIDGETHGLMGGLTPVPEPALTGAAAGVALMGLCVARLRKKRARLQKA